MLTTNCNRLWLVPLVLGLMGCPQDATEPETTTMVADTTGFPAECATGGDYCCEFNTNYCATTGDLPDMNPAGDSTTTDTTESGSSSDSTTGFPEECGTGGEADDYCCQFNPNYCGMTGSTTETYSSSGTSG